MMIIAFVAFTMGILIDLFRCWWMCKWWIWLVNKQCQSMDKILFQFISTKNCRMSWHYWFRGSFVECDIRRHDTSWESIEQHVSSWISPCTVLWWQLDSSRHPAGRRHSSRARPVFTLTHCCWLCALTTVTAWAPALTQTPDMMTTWQQPPFSRQPDSPRARPELGLTHCCWLRALMTAWVPVMILLSIYL